jgi:hypothetical protein
MHAGHRVVSHRPSPKRGYQDRPPYGVERRPPRPASGWEGRMHPKDLIDIGRRKTSRIEPPPLRAGHERPSMVDRSQEESEGGDGAFIRVERNAAHVSVGRGATVAMGR